MVSAASVGELPAFKELPEMAGHPQVSARLGTVEVEKSEGAMVGIWEMFGRQFSPPGHPKREFSHFLKGRCTFTFDGGEPVEIKAGEAAYFPAELLWYLGGHRSNPQDFHHPRLNQQLARV